MDSHTFTGWSDATHTLGCYSNRNWLELPESFRQRFFFYTSNIGSFVVVRAEFSLLPQLKVNAILGTDVHPVHRGHSLCAYVLELRLKSKQGQGLFFFFKREIWVALEASVLLALGAQP